MFSNKRHYDFGASEARKKNYLIPVFYRSLSANTQNALEKISRSRESSIRSKDIAVEKIQDAILEGYVETAKISNVDAISLKDETPQVVSVGYESTADKIRKVSVIRKCSKKINKQDVAIDDHLISLDDFLRRHETNLQTGLKITQVEERRNQFGTNLLKKKKQGYLIVKLIKEFFAGFNIMLWIAAILCVLCWQPLGGDQADINNLVLACLLFLAIIFQSLFSFFQQYRADNLMASFESLMPHKTTVLREGKYEAVNTWELVPGDVVRLNAGDKIPADIRVIECNQATVEKSALTGESEGIKLNANATDINPYETKNLALFGSSFLEGSAVGIVFHTGDKTIMGRIADLTVNTKNEMTTMQREINYFALVIGSMSIGTGLLTFIIWYAAIRTLHPDFLSYSGIIIACIGVVVSFFPEGLPISVTMTLTLIAKKMRKINVLVKKLAIIETLGSTTVVASDKTGTITMNKMSLSNLSISNFNDFNCFSSDEQPADEYFKYLLALACLCNKALIEENQNRSKQSYIGSPTECGILKGCCDYVNVENKRKQHPILFEIPFNSKYKFSVTIHKYKPTNQLIPEDCNAIMNLAQDQTHLCIIKGAPEILAGLCKYGIHGDKIERFEVVKENYLSKARNLASKGERVLAIGFTFLKIDGDIIPEYSETNLPENFCFAGLLSLIDPPREGVAESVQKCHDGGIKVMMVTGDHELTAVSIARMVNIIQSDSVKTFEEVKELVASYPEESKKGSASFCKQFDECKKNKILEKVSAKILPRKPKIIARKYNVEGGVLINGKDIPAFDVEHWDFVLSHNEIVFARTTPENKLAIVQQLQRRGEIVTVTGDGVNDAPALKKADIGISMGIAGTEISKEAAKIVIMDDNFSTIVKGIEQGRLLFDNLKKVIAYLLPAGCFSEILPVLAFVFLGIPLPLTTLQMVIICLGTDTIGSLGMIYEYAEADIMKRKPRNAAVDRLISFFSILKIYFQTGLLQLTIAFFMYFYTMTIYNVDVKELVFAYGNWNMNGTFAGVDLDTRNDALKYAQTGYFVALIMTQLINLLTSRTRFQSFFKQRFRPSLILFMIGEVIILVLFCYIKPLQPYLGSKNADWYHYVFPLVMGLSIFIVDEIKKLLIRKFPKSFISHLAW